MKKKMVYWYLKKNSCKLHAFTIKINFLPHLASFYFKTAYLKEETDEREAFQFLNNIKEYKQKAQKKIVGEFSSFSHLSKLRKKKKIKDQFQIRRN